MFENKKIHMVGIGGISMSAIAMMLQSFGAHVEGSNTGENEATIMLEQKGIKVYYSHDENNLNNPDIVIYTAAVPSFNPELIKAKELNVPTYERSVFLGQLSKEYKNCLCISGTHGKSTTTGLVANIFLKANMNPTIQVGAMMSEIGGNLHIGTKDYLIMESCEYKDSFLNFYPTGTIITNIDNDHLDYFKDLNHIKDSFKKYTNLLPTNGFLVVNKDDVNSNFLLDTNTNVITYSINSDANYKANNITYKNGYPSYELYKDNNYLTTINLNITGLHNVYNSLSAFALSHQYITDINSIKLGIESYKGVSRRFEYIGKYKNIDVYDDYAHHPTELITTLDSVSKKEFNKSYIVFQGHTYSRTHEHLKEFADILSKFENIIIAPIYAAREVNTYNVSEEKLVNLIKEKNNNVIYIDSFDNIVTHLKEVTTDNDLIITVGAGPINEVAKKIVDNS